MNELPIGFGGVLGPLVLSLAPSLLSLFQGNPAGFLQILLDPFDLWFSGVFSGRPAVGPDSVTDCFAGFLIDSQNPVLRALGAGYRALESQGIPISTSDPNLHALYIQLDTAALQDLTTQFGAATANTVFGLIAQALSMNNPCSNRQAFALLGQADLFYAAAIQNGSIDPNTGFLFPPPPPPPPPDCGLGLYNPELQECQCYPPATVDPASGKCLIFCPVGFVWDFVKSLCVPVEMAPPPPPTPVCCQ